MTDHKNSQLSILCIIGTYEPILLRMICFINWSIFITICD